VVQTVAVGLRFGKQFDGLPVVDLDEREADAAIGVVKRIRFAVAEKILVERAGLFKVVDVQRDVRQAGDVRTLRFDRRKQRQRCGKKKCKGEFGFHAIE